MNKNYIACFDTETGGINPHSCELLSIACVIIHPRTLTVVEGSEFYSLVKPEIPENVEPGALAVNKLIMDELMLAPSLESVWTNFVTYLKKYNLGNTPWNRPVACGYNIVSFDLPIIYRLAKKFGAVDKNDNQTLFHPRDKYDLISDCFRWFENRGDISSISLDNMREMMGISKSGAHSAIVDAKQTAELAIRFLKLYRNLEPRVTFKNAFKTNA